jgi:hypothetical protein
MNNVCVGLFVLGIVAITPQFGNASPISGTFDLAGFANAVVTPTAIDFMCSSGGAAALLAPCALGPAGAGNFINTAGTGDFTPYVGQGGYVKDINNAIAPVNQPFLLPNFITFASTPLNPVVPPDIALDLTFIFGGVSGSAQCSAPPAPGQTCTPMIPALVTPANPLGLSPFNLQNLAGGVSSASFSFAGVARRLSTGESDPFYGVLSSQFTVPYQTVLADFLRGGFVSTSYSATVSVTPIPEPATATLGIVAALLLGGVGAIRKKLTRL